MTKSDERPEVFGDGSTREQQDEIVKRNQEAQEQITAAARAGRGSESPAGPGPVKAQGSPPPPPAKHAESKPSS